MSQAIAQDEFVYSVVYHGANLYTGTDPLQVATLKGYADLWYRGKHVGYLNYNGEWSVWWGRSATDEIKSQFELPTVHPSK